MCTCSITQSCPTLCDPMDCSLPGSSVHSISQARILEWVAILPSRGSFQPRGQSHISSVSCIGRQILCHYATLPPSKLWEEPLQLPSNNLPRIWLIWDWVDYLYHPEGCVGAELSSPETPPSPWICLHLFRGRNPRNPISRYAWGVCVCGVVSVQYVCVTHTALWLTLWNCF